MSESTGIRRGYRDPDAGWFKMRDVWARDDRLDWGALGLLAYLTSHRDGFEVALVQVYKARASKRHKLDVWLSELESAGYVRRETRRVGGVVVGTTWHLLDPLAPDVGQQH